MQKNDETKGKGNDIDFGERMYDTRLGRWNSVDPLARKYPSQSPYAFVGGSPIMNREIDGRDYDVAIDHVARTITVKASYFVPNKNDVRATKVKDMVIAFWNGQNGKFDYVVGRGNKAIKYEVKFELTNAEVRYKSDIDPSYTGYEVPPGRPTPNSVAVTPDVAFDNANPQRESESVEGINVNDRLEVPVRNVSRPDVIAHEGGHGLGARHSRRGLMQAILGGSFAVTRETISDILGGAGIGRSKSLKTNKNPQLGRAVNITTNGTAPKGFDEGSINKK